MTDYAPSPNANRLAVPKGQSKAEAHRSTMKGIGLYVAALTIIGLQDAVTKLLAHDYPISQFLMLRFATFLAFAIFYAATHGGILAACQSQRPLLQVVRCGLLVIDIALFCIAVRLLGLADVHALYATAPLMATLIAPFVVGEQVGWRRRTAVGIGLLGALVIIRPGLGVFHWPAAMVLAAALCWALYGVLTRLNNRSDGLATSTLYLALIGTAAFLPFGIVTWRQPDAIGWFYMAVVCVTGIAGHMMFVRALDYAPVVVLQPFNYLLLVWAAVFGLLIFGSFPDVWTITGGIIVVASGLYVAWREWVRSRPVIATGQR